VKLRGCFEVCESREGIDMYEGEGLGRLIIDLDAVLGEAASMMTSRSDINYTVGRAINELYPEKTKPLRDRMDMMWRLTNDGDERDE
jgi:hypothetical protein